MNNSGGEDTALPSRSRPGQGVSLQQRHAKSNPKRTKEANAKTNARNNPERTSEQVQAMNAKRKEDATERDEQRVRVGTGITDTPYYSLSILGNFIE